MARVSDRIEYLSSDEQGGIFDLSATGVAFLHSAPLKKDSSVQIEINDIPMEAEVVYCQERTDGFRIGLHFKNLSNKSSEELILLVDNFSRGIPLSCRIVEEVPKRV